jgi:integrase
MGHLEKQLGKIGSFQRFKNIQFTQKSVFWNNLFPKSHSENTLVQWYSLQGNRKTRERYDRKYINKLVNFVRSVFYWAGRKKLVSGRLVYELQLVPHLEYGDALKANPEREDADIEAVKTFVKVAPPQIGDMVLLEVLTGMRPGELCNLTVGEINQKYDGENWLYLPKHHIP